MTLQQQIIKALGAKPQINAEEEIRRSIDFLKSYLQTYPFIKSLVLGISGGQDSTLAGKLCQMAINELRLETGNESLQFIAVRLPYGVQADEQDCQDAIAFIQPDRVLTVNIKGAVLASEQISTLCIDLADVNLAQHVLKELTILPPVWGLVNLAGISQGSTIDELSEADWQRSFAVNVDPVFRLIQAVSPQMKANGGGSIINVSSPVGYIGARKPSYAASKAALHGLTMSCARNLGEFNIRVNLLLPGTTITEMTKDWSVERQQAIAEESWLKRLCTPQEIAESIAFLLSEHSRYMTGSVLDMTCGSMCGH